MKTARVKTLVLNGLAGDLLIIAASILLAVLLAQSGLITKLLASTYSMNILGSFIAGLFFTSFFTTAPAIVALGELSLVNELLIVASVGAIGATLGDLVIFHFIRDRFSDHLMEVIKHEGWGRKTRALFKNKLARLVTPFLGFLIISSPLPDELGVSLLGFNKIKLAMFIPISYCANFVGIVVVGLVARGIS